MTIRTQAELKALQAYLVDKIFIALDCETTGVEKDSEIIGFSVCAQQDDGEYVGYYVITAYWDVAQQKLVYLETKDGAPSFMRSLVNKSLILHNAGFDCSRISENYGVELMHSVHTDTLLLGHLLNENRSNGLKERAVELYGENARAEQTAMKESVHKNGGQLTKECYELYKADADLIALYGAQDAILTMKLFHHDVPILYEEGLGRFFYEDETMPLVRGPTYDMNTTGLRVDPQKLQLLKQQLEADCLEAKGFIDKEVAQSVLPKYTGKSKAKTFNIGSGQQLSWLLFGQLENEFRTLTDAGKEVCKYLEMKVPYTAAAKRDFIWQIQQRLGEEYCPAKWNPKTKKMGKPKKIGEPWKYTACGKETLALYEAKYQWVARLLKYKKDLKLLNTYVGGIQSRAKYNIIRPNFLQHGTTSGRYSCKNPNFQNLPKDDKRVKACIVARAGKVFVGADYSQLEPRVFASVSQDVRLLKCFADGDDFYSVIGADTFDAHDCTLRKDDSPNSFPVKYKKLRDGSKVFALATPYGTTAFRMAPQLKKSVQDTQDLIDRYFERYPSVHKMMLDSHKQAKTEGVVYNLYGRPRRIPKAKLIPELFGAMAHVELPYEWRNILNLSMNHRVQSTGASIMNRSAISVWCMIHELAQDDALWLEVKIVLQVHDQLVLEGPKELEEAMKAVLKAAMEDTVILPGVALIAEPFASNDLSGQK